MIQAMTIWKDDHQYTISQGFDGTINKELKEYTFTIKGDAVGKARPRYGNGRMYSPRSNQLYEKLVEHTIYQKYGMKIDKCEGDVQVLIEIGQKIPKNDSKKKRKEKLDGSIPCTHKPDVDNVAKIILDAMNRIIYEDDAQVIKLNVERQWVEEPYVSVFVKEL